MSERAWAMWRAKLLGCALTKGAGTGLSSTQHVTPVERNVLRTFGARGGKATVQRRANNPEEREPLRKGWEKANKRRELKGVVLESQVRAAILQQQVEVGTMPSTKELAQEFGVTERRIMQIRQKLGLQAKRGRPKRETP